jgi:hypothetical protein
MPNASTIVTSRGAEGVPPNLADYEAARATFT